MEEKKFKVGHIIVVIDGDAVGNPAGTITCVTAVKMEKYITRNKRKYNVKCVTCSKDKRKFIICRAIKRSNHYKPNHINVKIPSYYEKINDVRHATPEEKKLYWEGVKNEEYW